MTFTELYQKYLKLIWDAFLFDIDVFSRWWLYAPLFIPFVFYLAFFMLKWVFLTAPIWIPASVIYGAISEIFSRNKYIITTSNDDKKEKK